MSIPPYFSTLTSLAIASILILVSFVFKINVVYLEVIGKMPTWVAIVPAAVVVGLTWGKKVPPMVLKIAYVLLAIFAVVFTFSQLQYSIENSAEDYESMSDWNAAKGLSWMLFGVLLKPLVLLAFGDADGLRHAEGLTDQFNVFATENNDEGFVIG